MRVEEVGNLHLVALQLKEGVHNVLILLNECEVEAPSY